MAYQVKFSETTNPLKPSITVEDQTLNTETSLTFVGKNYSGYGPVVAENFLHLLENFSKNTPPVNPVEGQLWYDNNTGVNLLKVFDGTSWNPTGSIKKSAVAPTIANSTGDIWINTDTNQLYISSGSTWLLVGPQYSYGVKTGPEIETITDTDNVDHNVTTIFSEDYRIAIVSKSAFTPKSTIPGFATINQGVNLSTVDASNTTSPTKFWGRASEADALNVSGNSVSAVNFLRSDITSTTNHPFNIRSQDGLTLGSDLTFNVRTTDTSTVLYSKGTDKNINFRITTSGSDELNPGEYIVLSVNAKNGRLGVGCSTAEPQAALNPQATLDVNGDVRTSGIVKIDDITDADGVGSSCSLSTQGGFSANKKSYFGDSIFSYGTINVDRLDSNSNPIVGAVALQPASTTANLAYDIGTSTRKFRNIYAETFVGNVQGTFTGNLTGNINGSATRLASPTTFRIRGDVTSSPDVVFDGQTTDGYATLNTVIGADLINAKTQVFDSFDNDMLLIYRGGIVNSGLKKISKASFVANIATVPVGAIMPFAGSTPPAGYLLCDGSEVSVSTYITLFEVIGYTYKPVTSLIGQASFALPDLRGRFALGRDNMDNGKTIPDKISPSVLIDAGGGPANNVTSVVADTLGASSGTESKSIDTNNLPDHKHNLSSSEAQYYAVGVPGISDPNAIPSRGLPSGAIDGYGLPNSGSVISTSLGQPVNVMNPYLTINYIIYTGVIE